MTESESITPYKPLFHILEILTLPSHYIHFWWHYWQTIWKI